MDIQKEASCDTRMQKWYKEPRPDIAATKQKGIHQDLQKNHWTADCEVNCQFYCWVAKDQGLAVVEGSAIYEKKRTY
jgi:hypothetical protein